MGLLPARRLSRLSSPARRGGPGNLALLGRSQIIAAGIPAVVGVAALARCSCRAESGKTLHVWDGGAVPGLAASAGQLPGLRRTPPAGARYPRMGRSPGSSRIPGVAPGGARFQRW